MCPGPQRRRACYQVYNDVTSYDRIKLGVNMAFQILITSLSIIPMSACPFARGIQMNNMFGMSVAAWN